MTGMGYRRWATGVVLASAVVAGAGGGKLWSEAAVAQEAATCVSRTATPSPATARVELRGVNGCGIAVAYTLCAVSGLTPEPVRFARTLKAGEAWAFSVPAAAGSMPIVKSDYCRATPAAASCAVTCPTVAGFGKPEWLLAPDLADHFPTGALRQGVSGKVVLACTFAAAGGKLENCGVASETPAGMGFGTAALRASRGFRAAAKARDGRPIAGTAIEVPITFTAPD